MKFEAKKIGPELLRGLAAKREKNSHKGDFGRVLIVAGSKGMSGAAVLASMAALKAGAGLATVAAPSQIWEIVARSIPEAMTFDAGGEDGFFNLASARSLLEFAREKPFDLALVGPGLSMKGETPDFAAEIMKKLDIPLLIDADGLNAAAEKGFENIFPLPCPCVITPHPGEAGRLLGSGSGDRAQMGLKLKDLTGAVIVLKGNGTLIFAGDECFENTSGGPELSKGGSGDVLSGFIAGIWAQFKKRGFTAETAMASSILGTHLHGLCGELAAEKMTERCVLAGELTDFLPEAYRKISDEL